FIRAGCVDNEQVLLFADAIYDKVINNAAMIIEHKRVLAHAGAELVDIVGQHGVEPIPPTAAIDDELAHVRNVEHADIVPHCLMFLDNTGVLHRHQPAGEWNHLRAKPDVLVVKRCLLMRGLAHERKLSGAVIMCKAGSGGKPGRCCASVTAPKTMKSFR